MKTIIEDFSHIASRLTEIEQEKHTAIMTAPAESDISEQSLYPSIYGMYGLTAAPGMTDDSGDTAPCEYVGYVPMGLRYPNTLAYRAPKFNNAVNYTGYPVFNPPVLK